MLAWTDVDAIFRDLLNSVKILYAKFTQDFVCQKLLKSVDF